MTETKELWDGNENLGMAYNNGCVNLFAKYESRRAEIEAFVAAEFAKPQPEEKPVPEPTWFEREYGDGEFGPEVES